MRPQKRGRYKALDRNDNVIGWYKTEEEALAACFAKQEEDYECSVRSADTPGKGASAANARTTEAAQ